jgi:hypothetical protein
VSTKKKKSSEPPQNSHAKRDNDRCSSIIDVVLPSQHGSTLNLQVLESLLGPMIEEKFFQISDSLGK